jgi:deazaflavin-dependent oxidoreductase (nitroreductase family)
MSEPNQFNSQVIAEFRANGGGVAMFGEQTVVILHTIGARSGQLREIPLVAGRDGDELLIFAGAGGAPQNPAWYFNLKSHPRIEVELGTERFEADVIELSEAEAGRKRDAMVRLVPQFAEYIEKAAPRKIPGFSLHRVK